MQDESQTEKNTSAELSPKELLSRMSEKADAVIADTEKNPSLYFGVRKSISDSGIELTSLCSTQTGAGMSSARDLETGATSYELTVLYHGSGDRGAFKYSWSTLEDSLKYAVESEMNGNEEPVVKTGQTEIKSVQSLLESYFPDQEPKKDKTKKSLARRVLASLRK